MNRRGRLPSVVAEKVTSPISTKRRADDVASAFRQSAEIPVTERPNPGYPQALGRAAGNRAVNHLLAQRTIQAKPNGDAAKLSSQPREPLLPTPVTGRVQHASVVQGKWILREGRPVDVPDGYVLQPGEYDLDVSTLQHDPQVILEGGKQIARYDKDGNLITSDFKEPIPAHEELQKERERQGKELAKRLLASSDLDAELRQLKAVAENLEKMAGSAVPKNHKEKIQGLSTDKFTGKQYRGVIKAQDELTQSEATTAFFNSLNEALAINKDPRVQEYVRTALRAFSSLRTPTETVNAPILLNGSLTGQQHPTSRGQEKLPGGSSSHSYSDRRRVESQVKTFDEFSKDPKTSATTLILSNLMSAIVSTLNTMAHPNTAENVPDFNKKRQNDQLDQREAIKGQGMLLEPLVLDSKSAPKDQEMDPESRFIPRRNRATSPRRKAGAKRRDKERSRSRSKSKSPLRRPKPDASRSSDRKRSSSRSDSSRRRARSPVSRNSRSSLSSSRDASGSPQDRTQGFKRQPGSGGIIEKIIEGNFNLQERLVLLADHLSSRWDIPVDIRWRVLACRQAALAIDADSLAAGPQLRDIWSRLNAGFRRMIGEGQGGDSWGNQGSRLASLEQYFAECGQMAVHNVVALENAQQNNGWQNLQAYTGNRAALAQYGNFDDNISEDEMRQLLAHANQAGVPVIGSLGQIQAFLNTYNTAEALGRWTNLPGLGAYFLHNLWGQSPAEAREIANVSNFISGVSNQINLIINTDAHRQMALGYHWITVRLEREHDGQIRIFYLDSLRGDRDYSSLFVPLRNFIAQAAPQNAQQQQGGGLNFQKKL